jgi:hypothetical protein
MRNFLLSGSLWMALTMSFAVPAAEVTYNDHVLFPISVRDKHGAINRLGEVVIQPEYDDPIVMREGLARVRKGQRTAYLDASGKRVIEPQEMTTDLFSQGMALWHLSRVLTARDADATATSIAAVRGS